MFYSFFKTLVEKEVTIELKNGLAVRGKLHSVDQFLNCKLTEVGVVDEESFPHLVSLTNAFVRGSVIRYVHLPKEHVDLDILEDATRKELDTESESQ